jgi:hypothetical protein
VAQHLSPVGCEQNASCVQIKNFTSALTDLKDWTQLNNSSGKVILAKVSTYLDGASFASENYII